MHRRDETAEYGHFGYVDEVSLELRRPNRKKKERNGEEDERNVVLFILQSAFLLSEMRNSIATFRDCVQSGIGISMDRLSGHKYLMA